MSNWVIYLIIIGIAGIAVFASIRINKLRKAKKYRRGLKMVPMMIHLPPMTDDIESGSRDERDVTNEAISKAQVMYSILHSTLAKGMKGKLYGQRHFSLEIIAQDGLIRYYAVVPLALKETMKQAIQSAYPTARVEEKREENIFENGGGTEAVAGAELTLTKERYYPIATYEDTKRDASMAILNALSSVKQGEGAAVQILFRPAQESWSNRGKQYIDNLHEGKETRGIGNAIGNFVIDVIRAPWEVPSEHEKEQSSKIVSIKQDEINAITNKMRFPAFETLIRVVASSASKPRSEAIVGGVVSAFSQFNSPELNSFEVNTFNDSKKMLIDYTFRFFNIKYHNNILNSVELASVFHLPEQNAIPNSQVERQLTKQVDGPAKLATEGILLGTNEFRGKQKAIYLSENDRRRHMYVIGQTGMGKSVFLENLAFQDMCDGKGFAFIDPHGDAVEALLKRVPEERIDDVIYFDPADIEHPVGMNMFEFTDEDQKDFIVQEGISMLQSLFDPNNQGFFGARGQHMFRNAALLLMSDPDGATFIDIPQCFTDPEFVKSKLKYVTDKAVYDYWTKEFPASQKSADAGEVTTWFASKWGPFLSNMIMRYTLGQVKSGFNIREIMDTRKIFLVNLSKGRLGDINANLLGMIFVMKFQQAAMSRQDIPEHERQDFCLYVDEFQNFATDSFESILSEARKYRLNLIVANQFMTQLTDKIREALLGNVGTIVCGRVGVTDAELMVKAFTPTFTAEDLTKTPNYHAVAKVMMFGMPSSAFTIHLPPQMGEPNDELMESLKVYSATKYAKTRAEVEKEIQERWDKAKREKEKAAGKMNGPITPTGAHAANNPIGPTGAHAARPGGAMSGPGAGGLPGTGNVPGAGGMSGTRGVPGATRGPDVTTAPSGAGGYGIANVPGAGGTRFGANPTNNFAPGAPSVPSNAFSAYGGNGGGFGANDAPRAAQEPRKGFLDDWLANKPPSRRQPASLGSLAPEPGAVPPDLAAGTGVASGPGVVSGPGMMTPGTTPGFGTMPTPSVRPPRRSTPARKLTPISRPNPAQNAQMTPVGNRKLTPMQGTTNPAIETSNPVAATSGEASGPVQVPVPEPVTRIAYKPAKAPAHAAKPAPTNAASGAKSRAASNAKPASRAKAGAKPVHKDAVAAKSAHRATTEAEPHKKPHKTAKKPARPVIDLASKSKKTKGKTEVKGDSVVFRIH